MEINGTVNGPTLTSDRFELPDSAYRFDSPSHIILPDVESIKQLGVNYSFSFWVFTDNLTQDAYIISKDGLAAGPEQWLILLGYKDGKISFDSNGGTVMVQSSLLQSNSWQHITITHEGSFHRMYLNGNLDVEVEGNKPLPRGEGRGIRFGGPRGTSQSHFTGLLDDIRIYNRALSNEEISSLYALESQNSQFQIIEGNFTWDEAKADAETRGGRLAIINTPEKNSTVMALGGNWSIAHIGLTDREVEGEWNWIDGTPLTWNDWMLGEPNDKGGEDVASIIKNRGWNDEWVERDGQIVRFPYILEILVQEPEYQTIEGNFTWQEAKADAEAKGGRLAVLDTQEKIDSISDQLESFDGSLWIGLTDEVNEGEWKWVNGEALTVNNWGTGQPDGFRGSEDYGHIWWNAKDAERRWNDAENGDSNVGPGLGDENNKKGYLLEILDETPPTQPAVPFVAIDPLYESPTGESITLDATPTVGFPTEFTYQWCFNGFKIPANLGGTASSINIDNLQANEGTWSVSITNSEGIFEQDFEYRLYVDSDTDGLSDGYEEIISKTEINNPDTDNDGLVDGDEINVYSTNPNSPDTDSDGFTDLYEVETAYDPNSAESVPDALVNIITAIEVKFNAALGATYAIEFSTDNQNWDIIEDDIVGEGGAVERLYSKQNFPTGFFRVERRDQ
jgi:hypothetical protein